MKKLLLILVILAPIAVQATNYTVKAGGGGSYTTIQACATAMGAGDTCTVYAGTYNENVTVSSGSAGNYKTLTVNGSDIVSVLSFTLGSHIKLIGNCPEKQGTVTTATCGFFIANPSSPGNAPCVSMGTSTDIYIVHNVMYACASNLGNGSNTGGPAISSSAGSSYLYIIGNTIDYPAATVGSPSYTGLGVLAQGDHTLVENNDLSHYTLGVKFGSGSYCVFRNNSFHDQLETEGSANAHTDIFFSEPGIATPTQYEVMEGNLERNAVGPNAKGPLSQNESCGGQCFNLIIRFNTVSRIGSGWITNDKTWPNVKAYNNTYADLNSDGSTTFSAGNNSQTATKASFLNEVYYYSAASIDDYNPYMCNNTDCSYGHNLYWCTGSCTNIHGHTYGSGTFTSDPGNLNANPLFVNYVSAGNTANDYHLQTGSPAIAVGTYLTTANGSGSTSTSLVVNDASYFQDGYGLTNAYSTVSPDCISVTTVSNHVCITAVNYSTNTLTLASAISWSNGDHVWLYSKSDGTRVLTGSAPDIGAYPFTGNLSLSPSSENFGSINVGSSSSAVTFTLTNNSSASATSLSASITGTNSGDFSISFNTCTGTLANGGVSCTLNVTFTPGAGGSRSATLQIVYSGGDGASPQTSALSGTGVGSSQSGSCVENTTTTASASTVRSLHKGVSEALSTSASGVPGGGQHVYACHP